MQASGPNNGFYNRTENSLLVVVFITDEDDCSLNDGGILHHDTDGGCDETDSQGLFSIAETKEFLDNLAGEGRYVVVGIACNQISPPDF